jgi:hypothetical protein
MSSSPDPNVESAASEAAAVPEHGLAGDLQNVEREANGMPIRLERLVDVLRERGNAVAIVLLAAPFIFLPVPGVSTAFGVVMLGLSLGVMFSSKPWMPGFVRRREISPSLLTKITGGTRWVLGKTQRFVRPRMQWMTHQRLHWLAGLSLVLCTIAFALPLPIPLNNAPPAIGLVLLALGLAERDGLLTLVGHVYTLLMWAVLIVLTIFFWEAINDFVIAKFSRSASQPA